ncbi:hypothetical protein C0Z11_06885 [Acidipropionibacterium jensenii]|uniref:ATP-binding cassette domain-containing protein n=1 Tax=Acidipropionibacterium jensenii TaxID=1749 RepID=UPI000BC2EAE5|nr:ATP-binding cassette domain-containing protein [Acidipropionibacterium jensenii]AZZ42051.1 hypothetical protein C0Z11_06885 [Acidipropionibacterium jensenii]
MILITHDISVAARCADQITVLEAGRVAETGPAARVLGAPESPAARALVAADLGSHGSRPRPLRVAAGEAARQQTPREDALLSLTGLQVGIPGGPVLADGIDLELAAGAATAVVGPSGTGKTTLVNAVVGLSPARCGRIALRGQTLAPRYQDRTREQLLAVQLVPQDPARMLNPALTVRRQLTRALRRSRPDLDRVGVRDGLEEVLDAVRLDPVILDQRPPSLSGGQSQRVAIARALAHRPAVLICDESTSALDPTVQREVLETLVELCRSGLAILLVTHDRGVAGFVCDSVLELAGGGVVGTPCERAVLRHRVVS